MLGQNEMHYPVFHREITSQITLQPLQFAADLTSGYGGHLSLILKHVSSYSGSVLGIDRDGFAQAELKNRFKEDLGEGRLQLFHSPFSQFFEICKKLGWEGKLDFVLADLGISSPQVDKAERGFSFSKDGPLDMRMDQNSDLASAQDLINTLQENELADIFFRYGEEKFSRKIAKNICLSRMEKTITRTSELADLIKKSIPFSAQKSSAVHPATRVFMALRIYVNKELEELETLLDTVPQLLAPGGKLALISFHSLEDRLIKEKFKKLAFPFADLPRHLPLSSADLSSAMNAHSQFKIEKPFPVKPSQEEVAENPRSRSAKLRTLTKIC